MGEMRFEIKRVDMVPFDTFSIGSGCLDMYLSKESLLIKFNNLVNKFEKRIPNYTNGQTKINVDRTLDVLTCIFLKKSSYLKNRF